jgi:hypothetical protein
MDETVVLDAISIPGGPFISGIGDQSGAVYYDINAYPSRVITPAASKNSGLTYAAKNTSKVARVSDIVYYSTNQGSTWLPSASVPNGKYGLIAYSADGTNLVYSVESNTTDPNNWKTDNRTFYSKDNGATWINTGLTLTQPFPVADKVNANKFYIYDPSSGKMYVSTNKGASFTTSGSPGSGGSKRIQTIPGFEGDIWVAMYRGGLMRSQNSGASFTSVSNVTYCAAVGFGKSAPGATYPTIFIWGTIGGVTGIYRSINLGATWTRMNDNAHQYGGPLNAQLVMGDMNVYGRVYMSTVGRGIVYIQLQDCNGVWGGSAYLDSCQTCVGGTTGKLPCVKDCKGVWGGGDTLSCTKDCQGIWGGGAFIDSCKTCVGGTTGKTACIKDCNGVWNGTAYKDSCGICVGGNTGKTACIKDCNGVWGGTAYKDNCNKCVGGNTGKVACVKDCNNVWGGVAHLDSCQKCVGGNTGKTACVKDCNGVWGGTAYNDNCNNCVGGNTGKVACVKDCKGTWGGSAFIDNCTICIDTTKGEKSCTTNVDDYKSVAFNASPNPFTHSLQLQLLKPSEYTIINTSGETVESGFCQNNCNIATNLRPGLYFLTIKNTQGVKTIKIIKL